MHSRLSEMTTPASRLRRTIAGLGALSVLLAAPATRAGFLPLPANGWLPSGQGRGPLHLPSLNIHTVRTAEHPSVAGGSAVAGNDPVPWVTWEENDGVPNDGTTLRQIFVAKAVKQAVPGTACPVGTKPVGGVDVNGFCWQQVGLDRLNPSGPLPLDSGDPTLNIDPTRSGVEPDIAFTGPNDTVAWVVWY